MRQYILPVVGIFAFIAGITHAQTESAISMPSERVDDSYAIYSGLIPLGETADKSWPHALWLIQDTTVTTVAEDASCAPSEEDKKTSLGMGNNPHQSLQAPKERTQDLHEALEDFDAHCHERVFLEPSAFHLDVPVRLLTPEEQNEFRNTRAARAPSDPEKAAEFRALQAKYKGAPSLYAFSQVYFNKAHTVALVYATHWCGGLCGEGFWAALAKNNAGEWKQLNWTTSRWIS